MKDAISPQEHRLLTAIILAGLCANSHKTFSPVYHVDVAVDLLNKLLTAIQVPEEVK